MATLGVGALIYLGIMPLLKTFLTIFFGYLLARLNFFSPTAARGASQVTMKLALPCLIFASIVPAFTPSNVSAIGPLVLLGFIYQGIGFAMGFLIRETCYVPRNFYQGIIVMAGTSNWGNLPTAVVLSVTQEAPFNPATDPALGVSFVSVFIVAYNVVFWVLGSARSISWDYLPDVPQGEAAERRVSWKQKPIGGWIARVFLGYKPLKLENPNLHDNRMTDKSEEDIALSTTFRQDTPHPDTEASLQQRVLSPPSRRTSPSTLPLSHTQTTTAAVTPVSKRSLKFAVHPSCLSAGPEDPSNSPKIFPPTLVKFIRVLSSTVSPVTVTVVLSIPIALIQPLKALFVDTTRIGGPDWKGPDGHPPLFFMIDTASFIGSITVPMALIVLGASFARLKMPRPLSRLPLAAMFAVAMSKMLLMPVVGVLIVQTMVKNGLIPKENKAERFVAMFLSGTPAAVNQLIVTQLYSPDGDVDTLSAFLLVQCELAAVQRFSSILTVLHFN
ncbi:auxin efflux carrier [Hysterangium stoloniferum]|nr:auxin efflux carrier [Hysterangium stoloniferum]